jgi:hypothetical protein
MLWKIENQVRVRRTNYVKLVTNEQVINAINQIALSEEHQATQSVEETQEYTAEESLIVEQVEIMSDTQVDTQQGAQREIQQETQEETLQETQGETQQQAMMEQQESDDIGVEETVEVDDTVRARSGRTVVQPSRFMAVTKVSHEEWKTVASAKAINAELKMLFEDLKALRAVRRASIKAGMTLLCLHMFVVEKYLAGGEFDKMKARLVADGRDQEGSMYPDKASPTVAIHSVFAVLGVMASKKWLTVAKVDVKGAFVQTPMEGDSVYMKVDPKITAFVINLYPSLKEFVEQDGCLYTVMLKAMYGCKQASSLWYKFLKKTLEELGYQMSETGKCVF